MERFARREGQLFLLDLGRRAGADLGRRSGRLVFRERFRLFLRRQFPEWKLAELSAEANLEYSLSPAFPRAFLRHGQHGWAAIACPPEGDAAAVLLLRPDLALLPARPRAPRHGGRPGALYLPAGHERATALRLLCLDPAAARFELFTYSDEDFVAARGSARPRQPGYAPGTVPPPRAQRSPTPGSASLALPGVERVPQARRPHQPARARHRIRRTCAAASCFFGLARTPPGARSITLPKSSAWWKSWTAPARPMPPTAIIRSTASTPRRGWNRRRARRSKRWTPRCAATRSTARCRPSPAASAASSTCWRWTTPAA